MTRDELLAAAAQLSFSATAAAAYSAKADVLSAAVTASLEAHPQLETLIGAGNREAMVINHQNHSRFIAAQLAHFDPQALVDSIAWVLRSYQAHGFTLGYWPVQMEAWRRAIEAELPEHADVILPLYRFMQEHLEDFNALNH